MMSVVAKKGEGTRKTAPSASNVESLIYLEFSRYHEIYAYWGRYAASALPLINAAALFATLEFFKDGEGVLRGTPGFWIVLWFMGGFVSSCLLVIWKMIAMGRKRSVARDRVRRMLAGAELEELAGELLADGKWHPLTYGAMLVPLGFFMVGLGLGLRELVGV